VIRGDPLHGERDDLLGLAVGVAARAFADLAQAVRRIGSSLLLHPANELCLGLVGRHPCQRLQAAPLVGQHAV
jgi:hypothetical protein